MLNNYMGVITLNENQVDIRGLTTNRPLASVPIGGRYRIIDFVLSNMVNSGIVNIGIFNKNDSRSLIDHLGKGKPWDLDRKIDGLFLFNFNIANSNNSDMKILENYMEYFHRSKQKYVIWASSYMLCNIDLEEAAKKHEASGKEITVIYKTVNNADKSFYNCDILNINQNNIVQSVGKNLCVEKNANISMEIFIMKKETLINLIYKCIKTGKYVTLKDSIYKNVKDINVNAYEFQGYCECINSIKLYYKANMDMLNLSVTEDLFNKNRPIYTKIKDEPPTKYTKNTKTSNSLIANGCIIQGTVNNSIISRNVHIHKDAVITNCIILQSCKIHRGTKLNNVIIDKNVIVEKNTELKGTPEFPLLIEKQKTINSH
ncbi:glucose-1-phosphate adenylyltransferase subunit GlgD [Clostridium aestuarii]|uniref:Glucose-1-phosphate adenylyltransferase subunit GlgD n=1 Tax=Clostridium aestuarii TaxID=338193 RepID=A0ABT4CY00_9CLOT|nr:glucose-1-phosphate adenylyltransferase subunit GlgD [Clostridium aestuarii]MCY6483868.1 glucose-1-phosphate adenylyltransferase subunit GlgD [Clostridium aestuarii]